jgi:hypothetical protein
MAVIPNQQINTGFFVPTTNIWESDADPKELVVRLYQNLNNIALALNAKETGFYLNQEFVTSAVYFGLNSSSSDLDLRPEYRLVVDTGDLGAGVKNVPHGLTMDANWQFVKILGAASNSATFVYYPLPYASPAGVNNISVSVTATNVVVTNMSGVTFDKSYVILQYLKS